MGTSKARALLLAGAAAACLVAGAKLWKRSEVRRRNRAIRHDQRIIILGAGFAGLNVAQELSKLLPDHADGQISLIDQNNFLIFTPMLTEVAGGELDPRDVIASTRRLSPRIDFRQGKIHDIDVRNKSVTLNAESHGSGMRTLEADHLIIALGSVPNFHDIPGLRENSLGIHSITDALGIRNRVLERLERANWETDANVRREMLTFVVGGGGYTGVETMAALNDLARESVRHYPGLSSEDISCFIVEPGERLLPELSPQLAAFAQQKLEENGVRVLLNTRVAGATDKYVELDGGKRQPTRNIIWAGGVTPNPLIAGLDCERGRHGGVVVDECCMVPGHAGVWAIGDCAEIPKENSDASYGRTAQNATREGTFVARNVAAVLRGENPKPFSFKPIGELALVGRHSGVARIYGQQFSGFLAWAMWRAIYLSKMPGSSQRARILLDWILDFMFGRSVTEFPIERRHVAQE